MKPLQVHPLGIRPPVSLMPWIKRVADDHIAQEAGEQLITGVGSLCATIGPVSRHTDDDVPAGKWIFGLVIRSDGHRLHSDALPVGLPLNQGDLYVLDPAVPHWTTCPDADDVLVFTVTMREPGEGTLREIAADLVLDLALVRTREVDALCAEAESYRGIEPV